ncbi:vanadium-dependent haloperoxidase [Metabacillus idriensis]|uniref:Phosphatase PAP2 family protein n=1 Tax=Metabacillus idriensis TaxID=324768 RepID=A0A6I2MA69_9BACI|nr:vanadium-dependent haloperoxidase [Metabacillus idriensis]MCM3598246.1 vanadium-dependent haloperoxidase [Metabacillus idriensis]MRX55130.1 phosphatase PAP2 family protein [Metabacillus idriensis]OHR71803.1 phosphoesterase [Bacillus sp. HMSC76G11]
MEEPKRLSASGSKSHSKKNSCQIGPFSQKKRRDEVLKLRMKQAKYFDRHYRAHRCNGDEELYPNKIGNFSKALPHNLLGEVDKKAYRSLKKALTSGEPEDFDSILMGNVVKLANPQAAYSFDIVGPDSHQLSIAVPPRFSSAWQAGEMVELYWRALTRDIPYSDYNQNPLILEAAAELSKLSDFRGPKENGVVTSRTLFRGNTLGELTGPLISQFLWKDIRQGIKTVTQKYYTPVPGDDYLTSYNEWATIQNGHPPSTANHLDSVPRYIRNGRDLGEWVHQDYSFQAFLNACLILITYGQGALDQDNPYIHSKTQGGFITFGSVHMLDFITKATRNALEAAWFHKWLVHRRVRPEEFGGFVHNHLIGASCCPIDQELLDSNAIKHIKSNFGTYLLPLAYPEGCPTHPSYPAGHASIAGACVTILKAFFNESFAIPNPVAANSDGTALIPYAGPTLTIGEELNKLASNIAHGRDTAGVHFRSDGVEGLKLGESVAIGILQSYRKTYNETFKGFTFTRFDGTKITI